MPGAFDKRIQDVRIRCSINILIKSAGCILTGAAVVVILAVLIERLFAIAIISAPVFEVFLSIIAIIILITLILQHPSRLRGAIILDEAMKQKERFSTTLLLKDSQDPFAEAARRQTYQKAEQLDIKGHFPLKFPKCCRFALLAWVICAGLFLYMPQKDLLGIFRKQQEQQQVAQQAQTAMVEVNTAAESVKSVVNKLSDPNIAKALNELEIDSANADVDEIKRQAIRKLGDISDQINDMQKSMQFQSAEMMQQMFKQLKGTPEALAQKIQQALAQGNYAQAADALRQVQKELSEGTLSQQQQQNLAEQLQNLADKLSELAEKNNMFAEELEKQGLDKNLAELSGEQLRQKLQQQGLTPEQIEELMNKAAAMQSAGNGIGGLGAALAGIGSGGFGMSADEMFAAIDQLDAFEAIEQQMMLAELSLSQIGNAIGGLGEGLSDGWSNGNYDSISEGGRGHGPGIGTGMGSNYIAGELENSATQRTQSQSKTGEGTIIASWYFQDFQLKGESQREFTQTVQAAGDAAAEAISENEVPRKYEDAIKSYFGRLEQTSPD